MKPKKNIIFSYPHENFFLDKSEKNILNTFNWVEESEFFFENERLIYLKHPFENKEVHKKTFKKIKLIYKILLKDLIKFLNSTHKVQYDKKYWEIIVGKWLFDFIVVFYEKYLFTLNFKNNQNSNFLNFETNHFYVNNSREASPKLFNTHSWNQRVFLYLIKQLKPRIKIQNTKVKTIKLTKKKETLDLNHKIKNLLRNFFSLITMHFQRKNEIFILNSYLGFFHEILLQIKVNGLFKLNQRYDYKTKSEVNVVLRNSYNQLKTNSKFIKLINPILIESLPKSYLEDYQLIIKFVEKLPWPKKPRKIFTSVNNFYDDVFKIWCAGKRRIYGTKLVYSQHGGGFQQYLFSDEKEFLLNTCDEILVWGKSKDKSKKIKSFLNIKSSPRLFKRPNLKNEAKLNILLIQDMPRLYTTNIQSSFLHFSEYSKFVKKQSEFINNLDAEKKDKIIVRLGSVLETFSSNNLYHYEKKIWKKNISQIRTESRNTAIDGSIKNAYIIVITQICSTVLLECLTSNIPFIVYYDPKQQVINKEFKKDISKLKNSNIIFTDAKKLSNFLNKNNAKSIFDWWDSKKMQSIIKILQEKYARYRPNYLEDLKNVLLTRN